jgi:CxxC motif-containing protein (DUF1111 family)
VRRFAIAAIAALTLAIPHSAVALDEVVGRALFKRAWVPAPSSTTSNDGLGPLFNARSCVACHAGLERGRIESDEKGVVTSPNLVLRLSDGVGGGDPVYGRQLQTSAVSGVAPEGVIERAGKGYRARDLAYGPLGAGTRTGAIVAPALRGLGALDTVSDETIVTMAERAAAEGVPGRIRWLTDASGQPRVGRFGWKASQISLRSQVEMAFLLDLGLSTESHPTPSGDCTPSQSACRGAPHGGTAEVAEMDGRMVERATAYLASIAPDTPGKEDSPGAKLFDATGCAACHRPALPGAQGPVRAFTDLLLHDLGPEMDGGATEAGVSPTEWRTAPLWGLSRIVESRAGLLHDGRAATLEEAIAFHGGDAAPSALRFGALAKAERDRLLAFLKSL